MKLDEDFEMYKIILIGQDNSRSELPAIDHLVVNCFRIPVIGQKSERNVPSIYVRYDKPLSDQYLIIFSHGNSTDIGYMIDSYLDLSYNCKVNVLAYDYCGYGDQTKKFKPSDHAIIEDIKSVYQFAVEHLKYHPSRIILYGQSLGSGPSVFLASLRDYPVGGLIVHSGYSSGLGVVLPNVNDNYREDFFPNHQLIRYVNCPVLVIHGTDDQEIKIAQARKVLNNIKEAKRFEPFFVEGAGHNNIELDPRFRRDYFYKLREYLQTIQQLFSQADDHSILQRLRADNWE